MGIFIMILMLIASNSPRKKVIAIGGRGATLITSEHLQKKESLKSRLSFIILGN